jgi:hypothetical protein
LHVASERNNLEVLELLLHECKCNNVKAYNIKNTDTSYSSTPLFCTQTSDAVEMFLRAGLENLELVRTDGMPLIHYCIHKDILTDTIIVYLYDQVNLWWNQSYPIECGEKYFIF